MTYVGLITVLIIYRNRPPQSRLLAKEPTYPKVLSTSRHCSWEKRNQLWIMRLQLIAVANTLLYWVSLSDHIDLDFYLVIPVIWYVCYEKSWYYECKMSNDIANSFKITGCSIHRKLQTRNNTQYLETNVTECKI